MSALAIPLSNPGAIASGANSIFSNPERNPSRNRAFDWLFSRADEAAAKLFQQPRPIKRDQALAVIGKLADNSSSTQNKILGRSFELKVLVAQYSMHLEVDERSRIFSAIDKLLSAENWHEDDALPKVESFRAFLKWVIYTRWDRWSGIGISDEGNLLLAWRNERDRVTAEMRPPDEVRWTTATYFDDQLEVAAGFCSLKRFPVAIKSNLSEKWFLDGV